MEIDIVGYKHSGLLDTGCDYSLIPRRLIPTATLTPVDMDIYAANGSRIAVLGRIHVRFHVHGIPVTAVLLVSDDKHEFMLGYDWLAEQGARWYFDTKTCVTEPEQSIVTPMRCPVSTLRMK